MGKTDRRSWMVLVGGGVVALLLVPALVLVRTFLVDFYVIPQNGMYPGLPAGSRILILRHPYATPAQVKRGDIIVFTREIDAGRFNFVWRVVGLPGDTVKADGASLVINGRPVLQEKVRERDGMTILREHAGDTAYEIAVVRSPDEDNEKATPEAAVEVPPDHFFVLGDNRLEAMDSRRLGPVPFDAIIGRKM